MRDSSGVFFILFSIFVVLISLFVLIMSLPRILKKKEKEDSELNTVIGAFNILGSEIKSLKEQLIIKERLAALGEVSAGIAHEFRNPMGVIAGYAKLLLKSFDEHDDRRDSAKGILNEIEEMNTVMEELLKFSRSAPLHKTNINASGLLSSVLKSIGDDKAGITLSCDEQIMLQGDETTLRQALKNLVYNALDAGNRVSVQVEKGSLSGKKGVFIMVNDNGKGIPATDMQRIFQPFYTTKEKGTGIGLALVQKIAMAHGGSINVKSIEGEGSTFSLFLPEETL